MKKFYKDKKILVTGAAGTVGKEIVKQLYSFKPAELRLMDNNETEMFFLHFISFNTLILTPFIYYC